jgi:YHS domain-containing protein
MDHPHRLVPIRTLCGRTLISDPAYFQSAEYKGQTVYFCTDYCRNAFERDPERFVEAHGCPAEEEK